VKKLEIFVRPSTAIVTNLTGLAARKCVIVAALLESLGAMSRMVHPERKTNG
jgi:hypothetical protein